MTPESPAEVVLESVRDRLIRLETILFKLCLFLGMNPRTGGKVEEDSNHESQTHDR